MFYVLEIYQSFLQLTDLHGVIKDGGTWGQFSCPLVEWRIDEAHNGHLAAHCIQPSFTDLSSFLVTKNNLTASILFPRVHLFKLIS